MRVHVKIGLSLIIVAFRYGIETANIQDIAIVFLCRMNIKCPMHIDIHKSNFIEAGAFDSRSKDTKFPSSRLFVFSLDILRKVVARDVSSDKYSNVKKTIVMFQSWLLTPT